MKIHVPRMSVMGTKKNNGEKNRHILIYLTSLSFPVLYKRSWCSYFNVQIFFSLESILYFMLEAILHLQVSLKKMIIENFFLRNFGCYFNGYCLCIRNILLYFVDKNSGKTSWSSFIIIKKMFKWNIIIS